jgi:hypothetical protein
MPGEIAIATVEYNLGIEWGIVHFISALLLRTL